MKNLEDINDSFSRKLTPEEIVSLRHRLGNFIVDGLGNEIYKIPGGYTGKGGLDLIHKAMIEQFNKKK